MVSDKDFSPMLYDAMRELATQLGGRYVEWMRLIVSVLSGLAFSTSIIANRSSGSASMRRRPPFFQELVVHTQFLHFSAQPLLLSTLVNIQRRLGRTGARTLPRNPTAQQLLADIQLTRDRRDRPAGIDHTQRGLTPIFRRIRLPALRAHQGHPPRPARKHAEPAWSVSGTRGQPHRRPHPMTPTGCPKSPET